MTMTLTLQTVIWLVQLVVVYFEKVNMDEAVSAGACVSVSVLRKRFLRNY